MCNNSLVHSDSTELLIDRRQTEGSKDTASVAGHHLQRTHVYTASEFLYKIILGKD